MLLTVFAVYDSAVQTWRSPVYARSQGEILRVFEEAVNNPQTDFGKYPSDYTVYELGTFNDENAVFSLHKVHLRVKNGLELVKKPQVSEIVEKDKKGAGA